MVQTKSPGTSPVRRFLHLLQLRLREAGALVGGEAAADVAAPVRRRLELHQRQARQQATRLQADRLPARLAGDRAADAVAAVVEAPADAVVVQRLQLPQLQRHRCPSWTFVLPAV